MAFAAAGLYLIKGSVGAGPQWWHYETTDAHATVSGTDYFAAGVDTRGMRVYDLVFVVDTDTGTTTLHHVTAIDADSNVTVSAATLS